MARRSECAGVVIERELAEKGSVVDEPDQGPEHDGAEPGNQAYDNSKKRQTNKTDLHGQLDLHQKLISVPPEHPAEFGERQLRRVGRRAIATESVFPVIDAGRVSAKTLGARAGCASYSHASFALPPMSVNSRRGNGAFLGARRVRGGG